MTFCIRKLYFLNEGQKSPRHRLPRRLRNQIKADFAMSPVWFLTASLKAPVQYTAICRNCHVEREFTETVTHLITNAFC